MQLKTIRNRVQKHKSFVYGKARFCRRTGRLSLTVNVEPRRGSRPVCDGCGRRGPQYDRLPARRFEFVPLWGLGVFFVYAMRRVDCGRCGVRVERVPWGEGRCRLTKTYRWFLAGWAKRLSWQEVADVFHTSWQSVFRSVRHAVFWGLAHRKWGRIEAVGIDEIAWRKGHKYLTLVYQIDEGHKRLLWIDRFHAMSRFSKALDEIRADDVRRLQQAGYEPVLKHSRWCLLKRPENLTPKQTVKLAELVQHNLRSMRAYLLKEDFQRFWEYVSPGWAVRFLDEWCTRTMRSQLEPLKKVARSLREHRPRRLNWFRARGTISAGVVEGFNNKAKLSTKKAYGFRTYPAIEIALYHQLADLPEPKFAHRCW